MIKLTYEQNEILRRAVDMIMTRERDISLGVKDVSAKCAIITAKKIYKKNDRITGYDYQQIQRAIALPNAILWFMSRDAKDENCAEDLATFIENNSVIVTGL